MPMMTMTMMASQGTPKTSPRTRSSGSSRGMLVGSICLPLTIDRIDAADDVERGERDDEARHPQQGRDRAVDRAEDCADADAERRTPSRTGICRMVDEQICRRRTPRGRATEPTERSTLRVTMTIVSPDAEQGDDRGARQQLLNARAVGEGVVLAASSRAKTMSDGDDDAQLAGPQRRFEQPARSRRRRRARACGRCRGHAALRRSWPVAARMMDCLVARRSAAARRPAALRAARALGRPCPAPRAARRRSSGRPRPRRRAHRAGGGPRPWCRRRCLGSARR